jgi:hypothetical protein
VHLKNLGRRVYLDPWANVNGIAMLSEFMEIRKITMCTTAMGGYGIWRYAAQIKSGQINSGEATVTTNRDIEVVSIIEWRR